MNHSSLLFPKLNAGQAALMRAEHKTGHVLDEQFAIAISDHQTVFTILDSEAAAKQLAKFIRMTRAYYISGGHTIKVAGNESVP